MNVPDFYYHTDLNTNWTSRGERITMMRLHKYLAQCGVASRRKCEELIAEGRVRVNDTVIQEMGVQVVPTDVITVDGETVFPEREKRYVLYHKPAGEITTASDDKGRPTVLDRFADFPVRLFPVGRLDYDSEGLLLLTNDGEMMQRLIHPSREVEKVYLARVTGEVAQDSLRAFRKGIRLREDARPTAPAKIRVIKREEFASIVLLGIHEGRNRQVRRMFEAVGNKVLMLRRVQFGPLKLGTLARGAYRELTADEVEKLSAI